MHVRNATFSLSDMIKDRWIDRHDIKLDICKLWDMRYLSYTTIYLSSFFLSSTPEYEKISNITFKFTFYGNENPSHIKIHTE